MTGTSPPWSRATCWGTNFMGEVVEVGRENRKLEVGDRVVVPFNICCGECFFCRSGQWSCCERTNRDADQATKIFGHNTAGLFGYSHLTGHYPGGQAEYVRVPYATHRASLEEGPGLYDPLQEQEGWLHQGRVETWNEWSLSCIA